MDKENCFNLGKIIRTHGVRGELVMYSNAIDLILGLSSSELFIEKTSGEFVFLTITNLRIIKPNQILIKIEGINSPQEAQQMKGSEVWVPTDVLPPLKSNEFYPQEIIGFTIIDQDYGKIGTVSDVFDIPSNRLLQIMKNEKEILIPAAKDFIKEINRTEKKIIMNLPEGLLDIYLQDES